MRNLFDKMMIKFMYNKFTTYVPRNIKKLSVNKQVLLNAHRSFNVTNLMFVFVHCFLQ